MGEEVLRNTGLGSSLVHEDITSRVFPVFSWQNAGTNSFTDLFTTSQMSSPYFTIRHSRHILRPKQQQGRVIVISHPQDLHEAAAAEEGVIQVPAGFSASPGPDTVPQILRGG